jgi:hypothetical protein
MGPKVLDASAKDGVTVQGRPMKWDACHSAKCKWGSFFSDLKDVVLGGGVNAQMEHGLSGHFKTIL